MRLGIYTALLFIFGTHKKKGKPNYGNEKEK